MSKRVNISMKEAVAMISFVGCIMSYGIGSAELAVILACKFMWDLYRLALAIRSGRKHSKIKGYRNFLLNAFRDAELADELLDQDSQLNLFSADASQATTFSWDNQPNTDTKNNPNPK